MLEYYHRGLLYSNNDMQKPNYRIVGGAASSASTPLVPQPPPPVVDQKLLTDAQWSVDDTNSAYMIHNFSLLSDGLHFKETHLLTHRFTLNHWITHAYWGIHSHMQLPIHCLTDSPNHESIQFKWKLLTESPNLNPKQKWLMESPFDLILMNLLVWNGSQNVVRQ